MSVGTSYLYPGDEGAGVAGFLVPELVVVNWGGWNWYGFFWEGGGRNEEEMLCTCRLGEILCVASWFFVRTCSWNDVFFLTNHHQLEFLIKQTYSWWFRQ